MEEKIAALRAELEADLAAVHNKDELSAFWQKYLSKNGSVTGLTKSLRDVPKEERPAAGKTINEFKVWVEGQYQAASAEIEKAELAARNKAEAVDITLPGTHHATGALHPITQIKNEIIDVFAGMGFEIYEGPEIEDEVHNFTRLNVPKNHPARDMQDTFYVADDIVLRTQTSGGQIRVMDKEKPPIKVLVPGRVFRSDSDATHSPMFHQMEGLVLNATARAAPCASTAAGSKFWGLALCTAACWKTAALTLRYTPALLSVSVSSVSPCLSTASTTSA